MATAPDRWRAEQLAAETAERASDATDESRDIAVALGGFSTMRALTMPALSL